MSMQRNATMSCSMHAIDTSLLYALFNANDKWHAEAKRLIQEHRPVLIPPGILQETLDLLRLRHGAKAAHSALVWLTSAGGIVIEPARSEKSFEEAVEVCVASAKPKAATQAGKLSFADVWCVAHAAQHQAEILTKDEQQRRVFKAWPAKA
jgi:predicted nucleic acid-binding protein